MLCHQVLAFVAPRISRTKRLLIHRLMCRIPKWDLDQHGEVDQDHDDEGSDDSGPPCGVHLLSDGTFRGDASFLLDPTRMMILNAVGAVLAKKDAENAAKGKGYSKGSAEDGKGQGKGKSEAAASSTASPKSTPSKKKKTSKK